MQFKDFPFASMTRMFCLVTFTVIASAAAELEAAQSCNLLQRGSPHASPVSHLEQDEADRTDGISHVPGVVKFQKSLPRGKDCVTIVSIATKAMDTLVSNVPHFKLACDLITGHYDFDADSFVKMPWFQEVAALAIEKPYYNKIELLEDLLANHRDILFSYKTAFLLDDDVGLQNLQVGDFVEFGRDGPFFLLAATIKGKHAWHTQDAIASETSSIERCEVLQSSSIEHQALLLKVERLDDFLDFLLEENRDKNRRIPCDWGFPRFVCRGLDNNTGTGCAIASKFGDIVHKDLNSQQDMNLTLLQRLRVAPCDSRGRFAIQQNHFRYARLYGAESTFRCFTVSKQRDLTGTRFFLQRDTSWKNWFANLSGAVPADKQVAALQEFCEQCLGYKDYLSDLTEPTTHLIEDGLYHVHIPKVDAGMSFRSDAAEISGVNVSSEEACLSDFPTSGKHLVLLREPRAHVLSQYYFCKESNDPGPSRASFLMPQNISEWVDFWTRFVSTGQSSQNFQYGPKTKDNTPWCSSRMPYGCYSPFNLQSQRLTCQHAYDYSRASSEDAAIQILGKLYFVGIQEAYQESLCLLHGLRHDNLPSWCDCENKTSWSKAALSNEIHGGAPHNFWELSQETRQGIDSLTAGDAALYKAGVERFVRDVRKLEERLHGRILCQEKLAELSAQ
eukprot:TRINITY_DN17738_c0_g1_i1.p1 TRINITY_DN17738_c0_g1~~TRINITY_DN17738_c0_g1_i1.p1  ORF type:complete len:674 (-),score=115.87 TRINITY_DN17738_c0_g1_i1:310-2331(-)